MPTVTPIVTASRLDYTKRIKDVVGRLKVSIHENVYEADFEYGKQPMRWEEITANGGSITHLAGAGGCAMYLPDASTNPNALTIRQSRPYHRYQPGKAMFMATAINFGAPASNQFQRVGFFDDSNGIFFEQGPSNGGNPSGMQCVVRSDSNYFPNGTASSAAVRDVKVDYANWSDPHSIKSQINWNQIQMLWIEYAWYGAGALRWGIFLDGEQYTLHEIGTGNNPTYGGGTIGGSAATGVAPWARTGNLPVRYEQRDSGAGAPATTMYHYGVSVIVEGKRDEQRGFTYSYGMPTSIPRRYVPPNSTRFPVLSVQPRVMGTQEFSNIGGAATSQANIASSTTSTLVVTSAAYNLPRIRSFSINGAQTTITFRSSHNLSLTGNVVLTGFVPSGINSTYAYTAPSPSTIVITNSTVATTIGSAATQGVAWATNQWVGRSVYYRGTDGNYYVGKITANSANSLTFCDPVYIEGNRALPFAPNVGTSFTATITNGSNQISVVSNPGLANGTLVTNAFLPPNTKVIDTQAITGGFILTLNNVASGSGSSTVVANSEFTIGQVNRGQIVPQSLVISADSLCVVELITSAPDNPVVPVVSDFQPLTNLGSLNSFGTRDVEATSITAGSGEVVYAFTTPAGGAGLQQVDLSNFFPLYNTIAGNNPDILTVAISTRATSSPGGQATSARKSTFTFTGTSANGSNQITAVSSVAGLSVGMAITGTNIPAGATITKIFSGGGTNIITISANATGTNTGLTAHLGSIQFNLHHGLSVGDQVVLSDYVSANGTWNGTWTVISVPDSLDIRINVGSATDSALTLGNTTFISGASVGAHLICQEAMS